MLTNLIIEIVSLSISNQNYITISLVIYITFSMILLRKLFYIFNSFVLIYILVTCNCIYIYNQIVVFSVNKKTNLFIDLKNLILVSICFVL